MFSDKLVQRISGKAVIEAEGAILALHPTNIDANRKWHMPGGIRDDINESVLGTAVREVLEETGINLSGVPTDVFKISEWEAVDKEEHVKILAVFFHFVLPKRPPIVLSDEHDKSAWLDLDNYRSFNANKEVYEIIERLCSSSPK